MSTSFKSLVEDARFEAFRREDFDSGQFTSRALSGAVSSASTTSHQLREDIKSLEEGIRSEVLQKQTELQTVVDDLTKTEESCLAVESTVKELSTVVAGLQSSISTPCSKLRVKTQQLRNLRTTVGALRGVARRVRLVQKLRTLVGDQEQNLEGVDLAEVARLLAELNSLNLPLDVTGVTVLQQDTELLNSLSSRVRAKGELALFKGQEMLDQAEVGNALQVFFNLHELPSVIEMVISKKLLALNHKSRISFDFHKLTNESNKSSLHENVWSSLRSLIKDLEEEVTAIWHLQEVLLKKTDPVTHVEFLSVVENGDKILNTFWSSVSGIIERSLSHAVQPGKSTPVREVLVQGFPRLCSILESSFDRLSRRLKTKGGRPSALSQQHLQDLMKSANQVQTVFSARSLTHITEAVNGVFTVSSRAIPAPSEIQKLVSVFHEEMKQAENSVHARGIISSNIAAGVVALTQRTETLAASAGAELRSTISPCNSSQLRNITLCSNLQEIHRSLLSFAAKLDPIGLGFLKPALDATKVMAVELVAPIFKAFVEELEQIVLKMHSMSQWATVHDQSTLKEASDPSEFVVELANRLRVFQMEFLQKFSPSFSSTTPSFVRSLVKRLCLRIIVFFVRHGSIVRPLSDQGRRQLSLDCFYLESTISDSLLSLNSLGKQGMMLRAFKKLLECSLEDLRKEIGFLELPRNVVLHHLFSRSHVELKLPHERIGLTPIQFSFWLDTHTDREAVHGIKSALEASANIDTNKTEFQELHTFMTELCQA
eukprot:g4533.t1